jgi:hypothetical protein
MCSGTTGKMPEQERRDAEIVVLIGDDKRHLCVIGVFSDVGCVGDDRTVEARRRDECVAVVAVDVDTPLRRPIKVGRTEEALVDGVARQTTQEGADRLQVIGVGGTDIDAGAVAQDDLAVASVG